MTLQERIKESLTLMETMASETGKHQEKLDVIIKDLVLAGEAKKPLDDIASEYRKTATEMMLLNNDMAFVVFSTAGLYEAAGLVGVDLELTDEEKERMEYQLEQNQTFFIHKDGKLIPRDDAMYLEIINRIGNSEGFGEKLLQQVLSAE